MTAPTPSAPAGDVDARESEARPVRRRTRRAIFVTIGVVVAAAMVAGVLFLVWPNRAAGEPKRTPALTQSVIRGDLIDRVRSNGKLSYGGTRDVGTALGGTVTGVPAVGAVVGKGGSCSV